MGQIFTRTQTKEEEAALKERFKRALKDHVRWNIFNRCCGFHEIGGWETINLSDYKTYQKEAVEFLSKSHNFYERNVIPACLVTTICNHQTEFMVPIFLSASFRLIESGVNRKTKNSVYMYSKILNPMEKK